VLIRYLCEFHASDLGPELGKLAQPLLLLQPAFTEEQRSDKARSYLAGYFEEPWHGLLEGRAHTETESFEDAGILVMDDKAAEVDRAIAGFLERHVP
jgi:hypothetical protein